MKILVVDDDPDLLDVTSYALRRHGYNILTATDGVQAVERCEAEHPDLILLDIGLPRLNGFEVFRRIRERRSATTGPPSRRIPQRRRSPSSVAARSALATTASDRAA